MANGAHKCFTDGCGNRAPYGFRWPGPRSQIPHGKTGYLWSCKEHRDAAMKRRDAAVNGTGAKRRTADGS